MDTANFEVRKTVKLNSGYQMPTLGLGTWTLTGATCETAVYQALKCGYRLIDAAKYYGNEQEVGNAVKKAVNEGICTREEVFITTKIVPWTVAEANEQLGISTPQNGKYVRGIISQIDTYSSILFRKCSYENKFYTIFTIAALCSPID